MFDPDNSDDRKRSRSLLGFGAAARQERAEPEAASLLSVANALAADAVTRHRLARSRREAEARPDPADATETPAAVPPADIAKPAPLAANQDSDGWSLSKLMPGWLSLRTAENAPGAKPESPAEVAVATPAPAPPASAAEPAWRDAPPPVPDPLRPDEYRHEASPTAADGAEDCYWKPLIDPMAVFSGITRSKLLIVTTTVLGAAIGISTALSTPKKYEASAELLVDPRDLKIVDGDLTESGLPSDATLAIVENQARVLTSGTVLNKVVDKLHLEDDPEFNGEGDRQFGISELIQMLRQIITRKDGSGQGDIRRALAVGNLGKSLSVERGGKTFVINISVETEDGDKSALIANTMTDVFLQTYGEIQSNAAGRAETEINSRLDELRSGVDEAERKVEAFKAAHELIDAQGRLISEDDIVSLNGQLSLARARTLELNAKAASARAIDVDSVLGGALPEQIASSALTELRGQYASLKQEADRQAVQLGPRHPQRQQIEAQLAGAREQIAVELKRTVASIQVELKRAVQLEQELAGRLAQLKVKQGDVNSDMVGLRELEREAQARRGVYEAFLKRARETGEQKDVNSANMSVISTAYPPLDPKGPSRAMIALTGMLLGFASGVGLGAMRGAYQGLRQNVGLPQRRRRWSRWRSAADGAAAKRKADAAMSAAAAESIAEAEAGEADARAEEMVKRVSEKLSPVESPADPEQSAPGRPENPEAAPAAQPMDAPMNNDSYHPQYAPQMPQASWPPQPAAYPQAPFYGQPGAMPPAAAMQQPLWVHPQLQGQPVYAAPYPQAPYQGQPYPYQPGYPMPQAQQFQAWPQPAAPVPYYPAQAAMQQPMPAAQPAAAEPARLTESQSQIEEIRESLREFREAVRDFTESRSRRKFF